MKTPDFQNQHACRDSDLFDGRDKATPEMRAICNRCPVIPECLAWALETKVAGFVAGRSTEERAQLRSKYGIPKPSEALHNAAPLENA